MTMTNNHEKPGIYHIRIRGHLGAKWSDWFGGFKINYQDEDTVLSGSVPDQAALHGIFAKIRDLGLSILFVEQVQYQTEEVDEQNISN